MRATEIDPIHILSRLKLGRIASSQRLAVWFEENRRELLGDEPDELGEEQKTEIVRRRELALAHPELLEPWDGTIERVRERLHEFGRQKTSPR